MPEREHIVSPLIYLLVLGALMLLLVLTVIAAFVDLDAMIGSPHGSPEHRYWNMGVAILIAIMKATLIILFFMHVKYNSKLTWLFACAGFVWLGILLTLSLTDYMSRGYPGPWPKGQELPPSPSYMRQEPDTRGQVPGADARPVAPDYGGFASSPSGRGLA
jgi:cytochrome c oxidase subunit 4